MPAWLAPAAIGVGTSLLSGILGSKEAARQRKEAARREKYNKMMSALDTRWSGLKAPSGQRMDEMAPGPSAAGAWAKAGLAGLQQGMNIYGSMRQDKMQEKMLDALRQQGQMGQNAYASLPGRPVP